MDINYKLEEDDYVKFNYQSIIESKQVFQFFIFQKLVVSLTFLAIIYILSGKSNYPIWGWALFYFGLLGIWTFLERLVIRKILQNVIRKEARREEGILGDKKLSIRKDGLYDLSDKEELIISWENIKFVDEREEYTFIFNIADPSYIIPNRYFNSSKERGNFVKKVKSYMID